MTEQSHNAQGPLAGLRVVEIASMYTGPMATQYLGDMGADVIKVESPDGDLTRDIGPSKSPKMGAFYLTINRNKRSVILDLKTRAGRDALKAIVSTCDIVVSSVRTAAARRIGITYDQIQEYAPDVIYCHAIGYLENGPYAGRPAYDDIIQAQSGLTSLQTVVGGVPRYLPTILVDKLMGVHVAYAAILALVHKLRTGRGQKVDVPMFETVVAFNVTEHLWGRNFIPPLSNMGYVPVSQALRRPYATTDGYLSLLPYTDAHWRRFFEAAHAPSLIEDPRLSTFAARQKNAPFVWDLVEQLISKESTETWLKSLTDADVPHAPSNSLDELITDPHLLETEFWQNMVDGTGESLLTPKSPLVFSDSPPSIRMGPPTLGQHTIEVLEECGVTAAP